LRVARMLDPGSAYTDALAEAIELAREAMGAIHRGSLGYRLFVARRTSPASVPEGTGS
jgi:hypothetical protein